MNLNLMMNDSDELKPKITVFGVGGAGGNAVNNMIAKQLEGAEFVVANTDAQALAGSSAEKRIQMGLKKTEGLGAGANPEIGAASAEETIEDIVDHLMGAHMCFITAGMGGGTGTGAAPIIAQAAREMGILTVGVVTKPFTFEGKKRMMQAERGIEELQKVVDTLIIIPNQNLFRLASEKTTFTEAFQLADDVLYQGVKGVTDLMVRPGVINLDFADVRAVMDEMGKAMMGTGEAEGENRAVLAAEAAIANPLLDEVSLNGAKGVLINITGSDDLTLFEVDEAANIIREKVDEDANIIVGSTLDPEMNGRIRVSVVATGIESAAQANVPARRSIEKPLTDDPAAAIRRPAEPAPRAAAPEPAPRASFDEQPRQSSFETEGDMPAPAWQPRQSQSHGHDADLDSFTAPRRTQAGVPSDEQLNRMGQAADRHAQGVASRVSDRLAAREGVAQEHTSAAQQRSQSRMGSLGTLIERMSGQHAAQKPSAASIADRVSERLSARRGSALEAEFDEPAEARDSENVEIPAFLRRQAN